tara:strand:+ start:404 stop:1039 length:636 start_codon:yes stop_codon:yes gene_type:complete
MDSFRRQKINNLIYTSRKFIKGDVLDIGGTKNTKKIIYHIIKKKVNIINLNKFKKQKPDILADFENYKNYRKKFDTIISFELLEYLEEPNQFFIKCKKILKKNGYLLFSTPFLNPIHGDKLDNYRITKKKLLDLIKKKDFKIINFYNIGSIGTVINDILRASLGYASKSGPTSFRNFFLYILIWFFKTLDILTKEQSEYINSGYFIILKKK